MEKTYFQDAVAHLGNALEKLYAAGVEDYILRSKYAEYLVALKLMEENWEPKLTGGRKGDIRILGPAEYKGTVFEVKSGKINERGCSGASFGKGEQITNARFDYCVFVTFNKHSPKDFFIFTHKELSELANKRRPENVGEPERNPCVLLKYSNLQEYEKHVKIDNRLELEIELHTHPEKFMDRWNNIKRFVKARFTLEDIEF